MPAMQMKCLHNLRCRVVTLVVAAVLIVTGVALIFIVQLLEYKEVLKNVILSQNSTSIAYNFWKQPKLPVYMQFYVFDLKNPDEVLAGAKPVLEQKGPYTYRESVRKEDITYHDNHTVSYRQVKSWHFDRSKSAGDQSDNFTTANIPLLTLVESLRWEDPAFQRAVAVLLNLLSEKLFITKTVNETVWGYQDELLAAGKILMPSWIYSDFLGIYSGKNNTYDGLYSIFTGADDPNKLGRIDMFNLSRSVDFWTTPEANMINGSDGTIGKPFLQKTDVLYSFISDLCRSIHATFQEETSVPRGLTVWRFSGPREAYESGATNPTNAGFCTPRGNCLGDGLQNLTQCRLFDFFHVPIIVSLPHFLLADPKYLNGVIGLKPIPEQHRTDLFIEPITGIPLRLFKRLQVNAYIQSNEFVSEMGHVSSIVFPVLWLNESVVVDDDNLRKLQNMLFIPMTIAKIAQFGLIALGTVVILVVTLYWFLQKEIHPDYEPFSQSRRPSEHVLLTNDDGEETSTDAVT